jgi:hypothetical protein
MVGRCLASGGGPSGMILRVRIPRPTYANVVATLALFVALGGASYAAVSLPNNSVGTAQLRDRAVTQSKLAAPVSAATDQVLGPVKLGALNCPPGAKCPPPRPVRLASVTMTVPRAARVLVLAATYAYLPTSLAEAAGVTLHLIIPATKRTPGLFEGQRGVSLNSDHPSDHVSFWSTSNVRPGRRTCTLYAEGSGGDIYTSGTELTAVTLPAS